MRLICRLALQLGDHLRLLFLEVPGHLLEHVLEHRLERLVHAVAEDAVLLGFLLRRPDLLGEFLVQRLVALLVPFAERDEMRLQPLDRIAERPGLAARRRAIAVGSSEVEWPSAR